MRVDEWGGFVSLNRCMIVRAHPAGLALHACALSRICAGARNSGLRALIKQGLPAVPSTVG